MTKPHFRIRSDGWIVHDGGECPVPPWTKVEVQMISRGERVGEMKGTAGYFGYEGRNRDPGFDMWRGLWGKTADYLITAYRLT